ncbi:MAG TPA: sigma-70 family RNA polymerase sigma factor [Gemmatimonadaceae bacterium]|nr:sigma-70 family RNA polymerase sigma factor [Gemmatimonadaceae bacterium]
MTEPGVVTRLLAMASDGDRDAVDRLMPILYDELHRIAHARMRGERAGHTLGTTALLHEAYLELAGLNRMTWRDRAHFLAVAARAMRRVLIDYAVQRGAQKREGMRLAVPLDDVPDFLLLAGHGEHDVLGLDEALQRLAVVNERQCRVVECRFFAGMSVEETAEALRTSPATVKRDWTVARAWLHRELGT